MNAFRKTASKAVSIADAEAEMERTNRAHIAANRAVAAAADEFGMDRRLMMDLQRLTGNEADQLARVGLNAEQRETIERRVAFHEAVVAERRAATERDAARDAFNELRRAAEVAALGDGRAALAECIRGEADAKAALAEHDAAIDAAHMAVIDTYRAEDEANEAVKRAVEDAAAYAVAQVRGEAGTPPKTPREARAELQDIIDGREGLRNVEARLREQRSPFHSTVTWFPDKVSKAVAHVVKMDPATVAVCQQFIQANAEFLRLKGVIDTLRRVGGLPEGIELDRVPETTKPGASDWVAATAALRTDPSAKLPQAK